MRGQPTRPPSEPAYDEQRWIDAYAEALCHCKPSLDPEKAIQAARLEYPFQRLSKPKPRPLSLQARLRDTSQVCEHHCDEHKERAQLNCEQRTEFKVVVLHGVCAESLERGLLGRMQVLRHRWQSLCAALLGP
jgi:hypothetical protein